MDSKILLQDLAQCLSSRTSIQKKDADVFVRNVFDVITQYLQEDKIVKVKGLGTFKVIEVSGRDSVNVNTGERIHISGHSKISFTPDSTLRDQVNRPFADFETIVINEGIDLSDMERIPEEQPDEVDVVGEENTVETAENDLDTLNETASDGVLVDIADDGLNKVSDNDSDVVADNVLNCTSDSTTDDKTVVASEDVVSEDVASLSEVDAVADDVLPSDSAESESAEQTAEPETSEQTVESESAEQIAESKESESEGPLQEEAVSDAEVEEQHNNIDNSSTDTLEDNNKMSEKEKVIYIERRPCKLCWLCFVLLVLALMALSYLAGYQKWFGNCCEESSAQVERKECSHKTAKDNNVHTNTKQMVTDSANIVCKTDEIESKVEVSENTIRNIDANSKVTGGNSKVTGNNAKVSESNAKVAESNAKAETTNIAVERVTNGLSNKNVPGKTASPNASYPDGKYTISGTRCTHVLKAGEGLYRLARQYYGNMNMAEYIIKYNGISNPDIVSEGTVIKIPELRKTE